MKTWELIPRELRLGNVVRTRTLLRFGMTTDEIRRLKQSGDLVPLRHGWLAARQAHEQVVRAVRTGGVLGCVSALVLRGAWKPLGDELHVYRAKWGRYQVAGKAGWCPAPSRRSTTDSAVLPIVDALAQAKVCASEEDLLAITESLIRQGLLVPGEARRLLGPMAAKIDRSDSGTETLVRLRLRALRIRLRPQVIIPGVGLVDFVIGDRLVLEVDSKTHHWHEAAYHKDRRRDQALLERGYLVMRVTWEQVMFDWATVERRILRLVRARLHRGDPSRVMVRRH